jgi:Xaa-Pro aminopeptidase
LGATTDITRTIPIGAQIIPDVKEAFTRVLMGHIDLASAKFRAGLAGRHLDVLARRALWDVGLDYEHGTGHGVGAGLSVHEDGCGFSVMAQDVLKENMVISNEPGFYKPGAFGIRIENLVRVMRVGTVLNQDLLGFETLTLVPIDRRLIDFNLLARNRDHVDWLDAYHARVEAALAPYLNADERDWLREMTKPLAQGDPIVKKPNATARHMPWPWPVQKGP